MTDVVSFAQQYLEPFDFADLFKTESLEIELFDYLTVSIFKMCLKIIYLVFM